MEVPRLLTIHVTFPRSGGKELVQSTLDNIFVVAAFFVALGAAGLLLHLIPPEQRRRSLRLLVRADRWWSSTDTTKPEEIDRIHDEEELKHLDRRGPTV